MTVPAEIEIVSIETLEAEVVALRLAIAEVGLELEDRETGYCITDASLARLQAAARWQELRTAISTIEALCDRSRHMTLAVNSLHARARRLRKNADAE
ncbi:hypothetical protein F0A17_13895 [Billgrantia pellis]|uniref:Uncharacterized protein n=1 Tax=Billgrantia pellis TaxID=2606936 RepID=A0A7V7KH29_9GAMM|nr:hypothetical protein [Halomonas pellis]KAA0011212.1 hypothetical protein F0A17_13895 [Halomonas pellis]